MTHRIVVGITACVLLTTLMVGGLAVTGQEVPPSLPALGGTALGALTGMLASIMKGH